MDYLLQALFEKLDSIEALTDETDGLLAENVNWTGEGDPSRSNSIVWDLKVNGDFVPMFITFGTGVAPALGKSRVAQVFVRIYDKTETSSGFNLVKVKEIVRNTLNDVQISVTRDEKVYLYHLYATLEQPVREDEAFNLNFIELEFDCIVP